MRKGKRERLSLGHSVSQQTAVRGLVRLSRSPTGKENESLTQEPKNQIKSHIAKKWPERSRKT